MIDKIKDHKIWNNRLFTSFLIALAALYPLRWAFTGLDLWDIGYSCGNYVNFNTTSISRAWLFSTWLSIAAGHMISLLPGGDTLTGLKIYCGLVISLIVVISSVFCIRRLKYPAFFVILGELWAVSICYIPSPILYNHMTFLFLILAMILLYTGLTEDKDICLFAAGVLLALNIFVRVSNATQALFILVVWYYLFLAKSPFGAYVKKTLVCMAGYVSTLVLVFIYLALHYGLSEYFTGVAGMLGSSGEAGDYSPMTMVKEIVGAYVHGGSRLVYFAVFALAGCLIYKCLSVIFKSSGGSETATGNEGRSGSRMEAIAVSIASLGLIIFMIWRKVLIFNFYHYATVYYSVALFLVIAIILFILNMADKSSDMGTKLVSALLLMQVIVMSVGSGTGISPLMNSAFIIGPYIFANLYRYLGRFLFGTSREKTTAGSFRRVAAGVALITLSVFFIQALAFGALYEFEEGNNGAGGRYRVTGNRVLGATVTSEERAGWLQGLTDYVRDNNLAGEGVIIYGYAPALSFYLELKPVITSWPDLITYNVSLMTEDLKKLKGSIDSGDSSCPIIIIDNEGAKEQKERNPAKWDVLSGFMEEYGYKPDYDNGRFTVYRAGHTEGSGDN